MSGVAYRNLRWSCRILHVRLFFFPQILSFSYRKVLGVMSQKSAFAEVCFLTWNNVILVLYSLKFLSDCGTKQLNFDSVFNVTDIN